MSIHFDWPPIFDDNWSIILVCFVIEKYGRDKSISFLHGDIDLLEVRNCASNAKYP